MFPRDFLIVSQTRRCFAPVSCLHNENGISQRLLSEWACNDHAAALQAVKSLRIRRVRE